VGGIVARGNEFIPQSLNIPQNSTFLPPYRYQKGVKCVGISIHNILPNGERWGRSL